MSDTLRHEKTPQFFLRNAASQDLDLIRSWLPGALGGTPGARIVVATDAVSGAVAGIASMRVFADRVGRYLLFVEPAFRRRGCGSALLKRVLNEAWAAHASRVLTAQSAEADAADVDTRSAAAFFQARGQSVAQEIVRDRADLQTAYSVLRPLYLRSERAPADPRRAMIVTADQVAPRQLADFVVRDVGGIPEEVAARLAGHGAAYSLATSMVALVDGVIVGAVLTMTHDRTVFIETRAVDPAHRGGWVNLALMFRGIEAARPLGFQTIEFEHDSSETDTAKLARRFGAVTVGRRLCWGCAAATELPPPGWQADALRDPLVDGLASEQLQERLFLDSVNDVIHVLSERNVEELSVVNHVRGVTLNLKLIRHGPESFDRSSGLKSCLLFAALPRSASLYVFDTLADGLCLDKVAICGHRFPRETINPLSATRLAVPGTVCHSHIHAGLGNLALVNPLLDRIIVHVRDPRQAMLSAIHHLNDLKLRKGAGHVAGFGLPLPNDYFDLPPTGQVDFMIESGLPEFVHWIEGWLEAAANPLFRPDVLVTQFEDMHANPTAFFRTILDFYGVEWRSADYQPQPAVSGSRHFRKGTTDEWRTVFTHPQSEAARAQIPAWMLDRFRWPAR